MSDKIKVLWLSDFACSTGFAQVAHNIVGKLQETGKYEFTVIGINHHGEPYDHEKWPFPIHPAIYWKHAQDKRYADLFGRQRLLDQLGSGQFDILFTLQDTFIMEDIAKQIVETRKELAMVRDRQIQEKGESNVHVFKWIFYYPIDSNAKENWIKDSAALADFPVTYTNFAKDVSRSYAPYMPLEVIYHGVNTEDFYPLPEEETKQFRKEFFGKNADKFIVTNVNRNQRRKDIPRTIAAFAEFHKKRPNSLLYLHMKPFDVGGNILEMCRHFGLEQGVDFAVPARFDENVGYPIEILNKIYNASDVIVSTTLGEGWGLSTTEAMATKKPLIVPNNTSLSEICADDRGILAKCGEGNNMICLGAEDMDQFRPLTDINDMAEKLVWLYDNYPKTSVMVDKAYDWVQQLSWENICKQWDDVFTRASVKPTDTPMTAIGRNDECPECRALDVSRKWKKCKLHNPANRTI